MKNVDTNMQIMTLLVQRKKIELKRNLEVKTA
jgi:hypothetical protein